MDRVGGTMPEAQWLGQVSTEGGPLLLVDWGAVSAWSGIDGDDYDRACQLLDERSAGSEIPVGNASGVVWGIPTGTTDIWRITDNGALLTRAWFDATDSEVAIAQSKGLLKVPQAGPVDLGLLRVATGWLVILWATENGSEIATSQPSDGLALDLSVDNAATIIRLNPGDYRCVQDEVKGSSGEAIRCWISPV